MRYQKFYPPRTCPRLFYFACLWKKFLYTYCSTSFSYCQRVIRIFLIIVCLHKWEGVVMDTLDKIMLLLKENGIEQQGLAAILGINKQTISDWKSGKSKTYLKYIQTISDYFNVSTDYLLGRTDIKNPPAETEGLIFHRNTPAYAGNTERLCTWSLQFCTYFFSCCVPK